ncbi:MAG: 8-oxo-dGTP diphosphatase MutT [Myxococcota bacterium]
MTVLVSAAVVVRDGRVLLTRRAEGAHLAGYWELPGGKMEPGEAPEDCVVRECREECAIVVRVRDILDVTFHRYPEKDVLLLFYDCVLEAGEVQHIGVADHAWVAPDELDAYALPPADERIVDKIRRRLRSGPS